MQSPSTGASALVPFQFDQQQVRVVREDDAVWFVAADVCSALGYRDAFNGTRWLDDDERGTRNLSTPSGDQQMLVVNEPGLYSLILRSRKPEAKRFKRWVTHEVLPAIRKTGRYAPIEQPGKAVCVYVDFDGHQRTLPIGQRQFVIDADDPTAVRCFIAHFVHRRCLPDVIDAANWRLADLLRLRSKEN